jgi:hypothetical protein
MMITLDIPAPPKILIHPIIAQMAAFRNHSTKKAAEMSAAFGGHQILWHRICSP